MLTSLIGVVVLLGGLIFFHEFGHYAVAKLFGVKVEVFSLGFGKKIFRRQWGETEYCLSIFPLGGYVKLMGDDPYKGVPPEQAHRAFSTQKLYKRFAIVAAGPVANLLLAYILFVNVFYFGQPMESTRIGTVVVNSSAWEAGLRARDRIIEVSGQRVQAWNEMRDLLKSRVGEKVDLKIDRAGTELRIPIQVSTVKARNPYGEEEGVGGIKGISPNPLEPMVGISDPKSSAYLAGLRTGDVVTRIDSRSIEIFEDINEALAKLWDQGKPLTISVKRKPDGQEKVSEKSFTVILPKKSQTEKLSPLGVAEQLGIYPSELFVYKVSSGSPAEKAGMAAGDRIAKVGALSIYNFEIIVDEVQAHGNKDENVDIVLERDGKSVPLNVKPIQTTQEDPFTRQAVKKFMVGFIPQKAEHDPEWTTIKVRHPIKLVTRAWTETTQLAKHMVISIVKLAVGKISVKNLGGPVLIASVAGKSLDAGIIPFLQMMALISINLFLLNLFPIPILDGGHLFFFLVEAVKGRPVSLRTMEIANQLGMVFILMLVGLTLFNDISRIVQH